MGLRGPQAIACRDWTSREGAEALAERIIKFWAEQGYIVKAEVISLGALNKVSGSHIYAVKTNLGPGGVPNVVALKTKAA